MQDEVVAEDYFKAVLKKYGSNLAIKLLSNCSVKFARNASSKYDAKFTNKELLKMVKKDITFANFYFDKFCAVKHYKLSVMHYLLVLHYIAAIDFPLFMYMFEKHELKMKLNMKLTAKLYACKKNDVISRPENYLTFMHFKTLMKLLGDDFETFYANSFPKTVKEFQYILFEPKKHYASHTRIYKLIQHLPRNKKYEMFTKTFLRVYNVYIFQYPNFINKYFIDFMPDQERLKLSKQILKEDKWICYLEIKNSIPKLKDKIRSMFIAETRSIYLNHLVETCRVHRNLNALLDVLRYFVERHQNENTVIIEAFINKLRESFDLKKLHAPHWTEINKLLKILKLNDEYYMYSKEFMCDYTHHLIESNNMNNELMMKLFNYSTEQGCWTHIFEVFRSKRSKQYVLKVATLLPNQCKEEKLYTMCSAILYRIVDWNAHNKNDQIDLYEL